MSLKLLIPISAPAFPSRLGPIEMDAEMSGEWLSWSHNLR